jgi:hypothetical protein
MALASHGGEEAGATPRIPHGTPEGCLKKSSSDAKHCHDFFHRFSGGAKKGITKYVAHPSPQWDLTGAAGLRML